MSDKMIRIIAFLAYGLLIYAMAFLWWYHIMDGFLLTLFATALCLGAVAQVLFDLDLKLHFMQVFGWAVLLTAVMFGILLALGVETAGCLVIGAPITLPLEALGIWLTRIYLRRGDEKPANKLHATVFLLPLLMSPLEGQVPYPETTEVVATEIIINAPPAVIWAHTAVIPAIQPDERIWTFSHAILRVPQPISAALDGKVRSLRWTKGVRFQEIITNSETNKHLAWDFHFNDLPSLASFDPHVSPNSKMLQIQRGFYSLTPLADGHTLLRLETTYVMRTPINSYLRLWGDQFLNDFHSSVLSVIKTRAEADAAG